MYSGKGVISTAPRFFRFNPATQIMDSFSTLLFPDSTATLGDKLFTWVFIDGDTTIEYVYYLSQTLTNLFRVKVI